MSFAEDPDYGLFNGYINGFMVSKAMFTACELGVFDLLESEGFLTFDVIADRLGTNSQGMEQLLDICVTLKLLKVEMKREKALYQNTELATLYLTKSSPKSQYNMLLYMSKTTYSCWNHLTEAIREGKNQYMRTFGIPSDDLFEAIYRSEEELVKFMHGLHEIWSINGRDVITTFDLSSFPLIYDLGESLIYFVIEHYAGIFTVAVGAVNIALVLQRPSLGKCFVLYEFLSSEHAETMTQNRRKGQVRDCVARLESALAKECITTYPECQVTIFEKEEVAHVARKHFPFLEEPRISFHIGDFFRDPIPEADLYILARILHDWADNKCIQLLTNIHQACRPGCGVLVVETLLDEDKRGPLTSQLYSMNMLVQAEGKERTPTEYQKIFTQAGFQDFQFKKTGKIYDTILARK